MIESYLLIVGAVCIGGGAAWLTEHPRTAPVFDRIATRIAQWR